LRKSWLERLKMGNRKKITRLETKVTSPKMFLTYVAPRFIKFVIHDQVAKWQDVPYSVSLEK